MILNVLIFFSSENLSHHENSRFLKIIIFYIFIKNYKIVKNSNNLMYFICIIRFISIFRGYCILKTRECRYLLFTALIYYSFFSSPKQRCTQKKKTKGIEATSGIDFSKKKYKIQKKFS